MYIISADVMYGIRLTRIASVVRWSETRYLRPVSPGAEIALRTSGRFCASSKRRTMTSHFVVLQMCFEAFFTSSEKKVNPAAFSTASTLIKLVSMVVVVWVDLAHQA